MPLTNPQRQSFRHIPKNWLYPIPITDLFSQPGPLEVDLGCGKGRFLLARAAANPNTHFLGIDRMLRRIRKIDHKAQRRNLNNIRLLRMEGYYAVSYLIPADSVSVYYIFFPDPWPKKRHHQNRIFNPRFLDALHRTLIPGGLVHIATDHRAYFEEILAILLADPRFQPTEPFIPAPQEMTDFELWYHDKTPICRCSFSRNPAGGSTSPERVASKGGEAPPVPRPAPAATPPDAPIRCPPPFSIPCKHPDISRRTKANVNM